ncbi:DUF2812 domain-containing protein [Cytobacillus gottheilii]|uniref:DUF2812 domain-containing protein n=1 Tax=Cytobacillus gottheilii TaxID=859144 RepID=A0ABX8FF21_9BACI|nr:DUF2812 domain-containing protein [Cytobacillus gottheilii]QVY62628.1 DUF2812 domain-containing protein [Cytobacillus gottheilii]
MTKAVYKLRPNDNWRIGEHESWFADMAAHGFFLKKMGIPFAKFVKGDPKKMRYRIEVNSGDEITSEQKQMYAENGWEYVTSYNLFHVFSSPADLQAPELHTDPAEQAFTIETLDTKLTFSTIITITGMLLLIGMQAAVWFLDETPTLVLIEGSAVFQVIFGLFLLYSTYLSLQAAISIRKLRRNLIEGKPIDHHAPWKKRFQTQIIIGILLTIVMGLIAIIPIFQLAKIDTKTLPESSPDLPFIRLADLENDPDFIREEPVFFNDDVDRGNQYSFNWSPLAPLQYETSEHGFIPGEIQKYGEEYSSSLDTKVYQLRFPSLAEPVISDLIQSRSFQTEREDFIETSHPELDLLITYDKHKTKMVFAHKGNAVMYASYYGHTNIETIIENTVEKIKLISE